MRIRNNRKLKTISGKLVRPTMARVREAVFNIWQGRVPDCRWLDVCAGSGSMGGEALCRGARVVIGIDVSARACKTILENWQQLASPEQEIQAIRGDAARKLRELDWEPFDCIYVDPPYESDIYEPVLEAIAHSNLLHPEGELAVESNLKYWQPKEMLNLKIRCQKTYGNTTVTFFQRLEP
ncbi:MAG: 16S rRNA (guanine(966)-N(2))-methyltransferase RsmD [Coleofasciculaceae cyanobacterium SM2_3_26]|nr:16S rRNA (guanine(966)-N(2))-methyltransferase RsmD [Coleofasciculaceae cyanobacterium SM2_3_26]